MSRFIFLFLLFPFILSSQNSIIEIDKELINEALKSLIVITDEDGNFHYEKVILDPKLEEDFEISFMKKEEDEKYMLTVYNEYLSEVINLDSYYSRVFSYYDFGEKLIVTKEKLLDFEITKNKNEKYKQKQSLIFKTQGNEKKERLKKKKLKELLIEISDVKKVNELYIYSNDIENYINYGIKSNVDTRLRINYEHNIGKDLFCILRCNNQDSYKYFYIPSSEIENLIKLNWSELPTDIHSKKYKLPSKEEWEILLSAKNEETKNECLLYNTLREEVEFKDDFRFFESSSVFFSDYNFICFNVLVEHTNTIDAVVYSYNGDELTTYEEINETDFDNIIQNIDGNGFELDHSDNVGKEFIFKYVTLPSEIFTIGLNLNEMLEILLGESELKFSDDFKFSIWTIQGMIDDHNIEFKFPDIKSKNELYFETLKKSQTYVPHSNFLYKKHNGYKAGLYNQINFYISD